MTIPRELMPFYLNPSTLNSPEYREKFDEWMRRKAVVSNNAVRGYAGKHEAAKIPPKVTRGSLGGATKAFVYVGIDGGRIKIGMSGEPLQRCKRLGCALRYDIQVVPSAAKMVETFALQALGATVDDDEWVDCSVEQAIEAVEAAWGKTSNLRHTDPHVTADEARLSRIGRANGSDINV